MRVKNVGVAMIGCGGIALQNHLPGFALCPQAKVVAGFPPIMPPFQGMVSEEQLLQLIAYLKSLKPQPK